MSKQIYMQEDRTIEMRKGKDRVFYPICPELEETPHYDSDSKRRTEIKRGNLVDLIC